MKRKWTKEEINVLIENYGVLNSTEIASLLDRTKSAINKKANSMGLKMSEDQKHRIFSDMAKQMHKDFDGMTGENNPNWKGGRSKDNYYYKKRQKQRYPEKIKAREKVNKAIKSGKLVKEPCEVCGDHNSHAHHEDYSKPLDVVWLCRKHHRERHC